MVNQTDLRKLLILCGPTLEAQGTLSLLREYFDVRVAKELDEALDAMRETHFDAVLAETADFLPLERGIVTQQAAVVLDTLGDGVCIVGANGEMVWANRKLREFSRDVLDPLRKICVDAYDQFRTAKKKIGDRGRRFSLMPDDSNYYEVICSPIRDRSGVLRQVVAVVIDATAQRRQQMKINAIDRAGRTLVDLDPAVLSQLDAAGRLHLLVDRIIYSGREVLNLEYFALLLLDAASNRLECIVSEGFDVDIEHDQILCSPEGNGICGYVAATGRSYICSDTGTDGRYRPGLANARSSLTVPLRLGDKVVGVFNVESDVPRAFTEEDRQFAEIFANHVALALHILNLLVFERHNAHTQVSGSICTELHGPIHDIITEATEIIEDYIGHDDLCKRMRTIVESAEDARRFIRSLAEAPTCGVLMGTGEIEGPDEILAGREILVADDEEIIRQTIHDVLTARGCRVDVACDGAEARRMLRRKHYNLVISDIKMPGATGYEVFATAKECDSSTQVILITAFGYDPHHSIVHAGSEGLAAVLMKPFKVKKLLAECRQALS